MAVGSTFVVLNQLVGAQIPDFQGTVSPWGCDTGAAWVELNKGFLSGKANKQTKERFWNGPVVWFMNNNAPYVRHRAMTQERGCRRNTFFFTFGSLCDVGIWHDRMNISQCTHENQTAILIRCSNRFKYPFCGAFYLVVWSGIIRVKLIILIKADPWMSFFFSRFGHLLPNNCPK